MAIIITHEAKHTSSSPCYLNRAQDATGTSVKSSPHEAPPTQKNKHPSAILDQRKKMPWVG